LTTAVIVFAHGSRVAAANEAVQAVTREVAATGGFPLAETAFLDCTPPDLAAAVAAVVERGAERVIVVPYFLTLGVHLQRDLPRIVRKLQRIHPGVRIDVTEPLDGHPALARIVVERAQQAIGCSPGS
jgi:sirohydrochlorin ferrochelatase